MTNAEEPQPDRPELTSTPSEGAAPEANASEINPGSRRWKQYRVSNKC